MTEREHSGERRSWRLALNGEAVRVEQYPDQVAVTWLTGWDAPTTWERLSPLITTTIEKGEKPLVRAMLPGPDGKTSFDPIRIQSAEIDPKILQQTDFFRVDLTDAFYCWNASSRLFKSADYTLGFVFSSTEHEEVVSDLMRESTLIPPDELSQGIDELSKRYVG